MSDSLTNAQTTLARIENTGIVPVVRASSADEAQAVVEALLAGGIDVLEITLTIPRALETIKRLCDKYGKQALIGAGTVLECEQAARCIDAGAQFIFSPSLDTATIEFCRTSDVACFPGAMTPTEIVTAHRHGATAIKVFPAEAVGGATYFKALKAPLPHIKLMPTGGVSLSNVADYLRAGAVAVGVGGELVDGALIRDNRSDIITARAADFIKTIARTRNQQSLKSHES